MIHKLLKRYHRLCGHRSHRLNLPCYRFFTMDGYCGKHNWTCYAGHGKGLSD